MSNGVPKIKKNAFSWWKIRTSWAILLLGFFSGLPLALIFSTLSLWLSEAGVERATVTYFSWAALAYSFKYFWAPLIDQIKLPLFTRILGKRRGWLCFTQIMVVLAILLIALTEPQQSLSHTAMAVIFLAFCAATQDIVIDAYRIEVMEVDMQGILSSCYISGYRIGMIASGAGALFLAQYLGSSKGAYSHFAWQQTYYCMAFIMSMGIIITLFLAKEPTTIIKKSPYSSKEHLLFCAIIAVSIVIFAVCYHLFSPMDFHNKIAQFFSKTIHLLSATSVAFLFALLCFKSSYLNQKMLYHSYQAPIVDFFKRYGKSAVVLLLLIGLYRTSDIVLGIIANVFYFNMGYSKIDIATVSKTFGIAMTILGSFIGGGLILYLGVFRVLLLGAILSAVSNLLFILLTQHPPNIDLLTLIIAVDNLSQGIAISAFVAWLSSLTNINFTATQYALFSSLMTVFPKLFAGYSGAISTSIGYDNFFILTALLGLPVILLVCLARKYT